MLPVAYYHSTWCICILYTWPQGTQRNFPKSWCFSSRLKGGNVWSEGARKKTRRGTLHEQIKVLQQGGLHMDSTVGRKSYITACQSHRQACLSSRAFFCQQLPDRLNKSIMSMPCYSQYQLLPKDSPAESYKRGSAILLHISYSNLSLLRWQRQTERERQCWVMAVR